MTRGASTTGAASTAASTPPAVTMNRRRSMRFTSVRGGPEPDSCDREFDLPRHELMVGAFGDAIPRTYERLELRVGRVHLSGHRGSLRLFSDHLDRQLLEIPEQRPRVLEKLDLALELRSELLEGECIL